MSDVEDTDFFTDQSLVHDPYPYYESLRAMCPVQREPHHGAIAVTGYEEANEVFRDPSVFSSCISVTGPFPGFPLPLGSNHDVTNKARSVTCGPRLESSHQQDIGLIEKLESSNDQRDRLQDTVGGAGVRRRPGQDSGDSDRAAVPRPSPLRLRC